MKKKYIIVTGGAGFVGSNLIAELLKFQNFRIKDYIKNFKLSLIDD